MPTPSNSPHEGERRSWFRLKTATALSIDAV
jgi:hypothetical protein